MKITNAKFYGNHGDAIKELDIVRRLRKLNNPFLAKCVDLFKENSFYFVTFEYQVIYKNFNMLKPLFGINFITRFFVLYKKETNLECFLKECTLSKRKMCDESKRTQTWSCQLLKGLDYLHSLTCKIIHHSICPW